MVRNGREGRSCAMCLAAFPAFSFIHWMIYSLFFKAYKVPYVIFYAPLGEVRVVAT